MPSYETALAHVAARRFREAAEAFESCGMDALAEHWRNVAASRVRSILNARRVAWLRHWRDAGYRAGDPIAADDLLPGLPATSRGVALKTLRESGILRRDDRGHAATAKGFELLADYEALCEE